MKKIGIIAAQEEEIAPLRDRLGISPSLSKILFLEVSGVGMLNSMLSAHKLIKQDYVDMILNIGVSAGRGDLHIGDFVSVNRVYNGDFDISVFDHEKYYMPSAGNYLDVYPIGRGDIRPLPCFSISKFLQGNIDTPIKDYVVDMEYYSIAYTGKKFHIPTYSIKCISDTDTEHSAQEYESTLSACSEALADKIGSILRVL